MHFPVSQFFHNLTVLAHCLQVIIPHLQGPTLIYHDGSDNVDVIAKIVSYSHPVIIARIPDRPNNPKIYATQSAILLAKSPEPLASLVNMCNLWNARGRVVVLITKPSEVHDWIKILWKKTRAADILAVVLAEPPQYFTWFPYKAEECSNVTTITQINTPNLFPNKLTPPYNNCPLIAVTSPLPPFVINNTHGIEVRMFQDFSVKLGMKPVFAELPPYQNVWTVYDAKYQPNFGFKLLYENEVDFLFSGMAMSYVTRPYTEFITPHALEENVFLVPGPLEAPRATAIIRAFHPQAWRLVIIASVIIYAAIVLILFLETGKLHPAFIHTVAIILNVPTNFPPSKTLLLFAMAAYMYSMHITTAYTTSFIVFLSDVPREKPMATLEDVVASGLKMQVQIAFRGSIDTLSTNPLVRALNQPDRAIFASRINLSMVADRESVLVGPRIPFETQARDDMFYDDFDYPKGHPLHNQVNINFIHLLEGGFPQYYRHLVQKPNRPKQRNLEAFGVKNVEGPFILHLSLLVVCMVAWVSEWICFWCKKLKSGVRGSRQSVTRRRRFSWKLSMHSREVRRR